MKSKIKVLVEKVEEYRSTEDAMRMALLTAQKMGDDMLKESEEKSKAMLSEAEEVSSRRMGEIQLQVEEEEARLKVAKEATEAYARQAASLTEKLMGFLKAVPTLAMEKKEKAATEPAVAPETLREEEIMDTVHDIDNAMSKITGEETAAPAEEAPVVPAAEVPAPEQPAAKPKYDDEGEYTIRPKFDFENLRFGTNFSDED